MKSRSPPAEISSAALEKILSPKRRLALPHLVSHTNKPADLIRLCSCRPPAAGVCEEATAQGHFEQPRADVELLPQPTA